MARVLVVEDDSDVCGLIRHRLNRAGYTVEATPTGEGALRLLHEKEYDLIMLDVNLPGISGLKVAREIATNPEIAPLPIVFVSVLERDEAPQDLVIKEWVTKPFTAQQLKRSVEEALALTNEKGRHEVKGDANA